MKFKVVNVEVEGKRVLEVTWQYRYRLSVNTAHFLVPTLDIPDGEYSSEDFTITFEEDYDEEIGGHYRLPDIFAGRWFVTWMNVAHKAELVDSVYACA